MNTRARSLGLLVLLVGCTGHPDSGVSNLPAFTDPPRDTVDSGPVDEDGDGYVADDCDDADPTVHPDASEVCNGIDDDCDGAVDEGGPEVCNGIDDDCDGVVDEGDPEVCNGIDDDCDGLVDEDAADATGFYLDADADGFGDPLQPRTACTQPPGTVLDASDCDDGDAAVHPGAPEICNEQDDDCDGVVDEDPVDPSTWYADADADTYGDATAVGHVGCAGASGEVTDHTDCDDGREDINPGAGEVCDDGIDTNCDGLDVRCPYSGDIPLAEVTWRWTGANDMDRTPTSVASAGDIDGDGRPDLIFGDTEVHTDPHESHAVVALVGEPGASSLADAAGTCAHADLGDLYGSTVAGLGDIDGDGELDVALTAADGDGTASFSGTVTVLPASAMLDACPPESIQTTLSGTASGDNFGATVAHGDLDGDGVDELVIGAYAASSGGTVYVFSGPLTVSGPVDASTADVRLEGQKSMYVGMSLSLGDVDGDGTDDLAIGEYRESSIGMYSGAVEILLGPSVWATGSGSFTGDYRLYGEHEWALFGLSVDIHANVDGVGADDVLVGAKSEGEDSKSRAGKAYVFYSPLTLGDTSGADADVGLVGEVAGDEAGRFVTGIGDLNADGCDEVLVSAPDNEEFGTASGLAYLLYGCGIPNGLGWLAASPARLVPEAPKAQLESEVPPVGDVDLNGDGFGDFLFAAPGDDATGSDAGTTYALVGG